MTTTIVGVDGSPGARHAMEWATAKARHDGDDLLAVHVFTYDDELARDLSLDSFSSWRQRIRAELSGIWTRPARDAGVNVKTRLVEDASACAGLLATAEREHADLIVVGANGHGRFTDRLLGATTYQVTHRSRVPVVVVPPDWSAATAA